MPQVRSGAIETLNSSLTSAYRSNELPLVVVGYGPRCVPPIRLAEAATGVCELLWLVDGGIREVSEMESLLRRFGPVIDISMFDPPALRDEVRRYHPSGIVTYLDAGMVNFAMLAVELDLLFNTPLTTSLLVDKFLQRQRLRAAGLEVPTCIVLPRGTSSIEVAAIEREVSWPAVLKPRSAQGSRYTFLVRDGEEVVSLLESLGPDREDMILEDYLFGDPNRNNGPYADYVSVESLVSRGSVSHVAVTGRFPLAENFRETGFFIPAVLNVNEQDAVLMQTTKAIDALGITTGCLHTEVKLTPNGPRIIEVNGRIGGGIPEMLERAAGVPLLEFSLRAALGEEIHVKGPVATTCIGYRFFLQPPAISATIDAIEGLDRVTDHPGVEIVSIHQVPGADLDWRDGSRNYVIAVVGVARDRDELEMVDRLLREKVTISYSRLES